MTQDGRQMSCDRQLPGTDKVCRRRTLSPSSCLFAFLLFAAVAWGGGQSPLPPLPNPPGPHTAVRLSPGDVIKASYADETIPDQTQKIRRDGKVSLPLIGEVTAAGKRVIDFQHELVRRYEGELENNEVLVTLENGAATVTVAGFANKPAVYPFDRPTTVYQAVMQAGGGNDHWSARNIQLTPIINSGPRTQNIKLLPPSSGHPTP